MALETKFEFDASAWEKILKKVKSKWDDIKKRKQFAHIISIPVYKDIMDHFEREQGPKGKWTPWSESYIAAIQGRVAFRKIKGRIVPLDPYTIEAWGIKPPRKMGMILQDTSRLKNSFKVTSYRASAAGVVFYNNAKTKSGFPYAKAHNEGGGKLPQREFMYLSDKGMANTIKEINAWLRDL